MSAETVATVVPRRRREAVRWAGANAHLGGLAGALAVAAFLDFWRLDQNGYANTYYSAAVHSMLRSWHNFLFASFDPGGLVSVDKPPLSVWLEVASAKLFGYSGFAIILPEALAGVAAVWILYLLVARYFGRIAGLVAALTLAVTPVSVSVSRDNNPDAFFCLLLVAAVYAGARAAESGRLRWLLGSAVLVGLAFNTKLLAALVVVPGLVAAYALVSPLRWRLRLGHLALAGTVLALVSALWIAAIELTPTADRPYVGSTSDNSALSLAFGYNGLGRVEGQTGGTSINGGFNGAFSGTPGAFRLINDALGDQGGWLLPLAIVGGLSALLFALRARRRRELAALLAIGGWFVSAGAVLSSADGIIHTYYVSMLAPATSGLVGAGVVALWRDGSRGGLRLAFPAAALGLTAWLEVSLLRRSGYLPWLQTFVIVGSAAAAAALGLLSVRRAGSARGRGLAAAGALTVAMAAFVSGPTAWSATTLTAPVNGVFPGAGPDFISGLSVAGDRGPGGFGRGFGPLPGRGFGRPGGGVGRGGGFRGGGFGFGPEADVEGALRYVEAHGATPPLALIVSSEEEAAQYVIQGEPVAAMGGFTGRETVLTGTYLERLVRSRSARYFLLGGSFPGTRNAAADRVAAACRLVPASVWGGTGGSGGFGDGTALYDCSGRAAEIAGTP